MEKHFMYGITTVGPSLRRQKHKEVLRKLSRVTLRTFSLIALGAMWASPFIDWEFSIAITLLWVWSLMASKAKRGEEEACVECDVVGSHNPTCVTCE